MGMVEVLSGSFSAFDPLCCAKSWIIFSIGLMRGILHFCGKKYIKSNNNNDSKFAWDKYQE
jgi:hypothetical protein